MELAIKRAVNGAEMRCEKSGTPLFIVNTVPEQGFAPRPLCYCVACGVTLRFLPGGTR